MDEMIDALTRGIGVELSKPMRMSYYDKKRFIEKNVKFQNSSSKAKQFVIDVMAMAIFNQHIIVPLHGAANFGTGTKQYGVTKIRMGNYHLDREFYGNVNGITKQFFAIARAYGIALERLNISSTTKFVDQWLEVISNRG